MEIERIQQTDGVEVRISGRLDAHWSDQLDRELAEVVRGGARRIDLDMEAIDYLSSAGIRILMKYWKELKAIKGIFRVVSPSPNVRNVLKMSGMLALFDRGSGTPTKKDLKAPAVEAFSEGAGRFTVYHPAPEARLKLHLVGRPELLTGAGFSAGDVTELALPRDTIAVGLGAFGADFAESRDRFGEFLALGGVAICLPTDASGTPDDQVAVEAFVPKVQALYAVMAQGAFAHFFHFEPDTADGHPLPLSRLVETAFSLCGTDAAAFVLIAESDGLVGARLRRTPVEAGAVSPFAFPDARDWFALTTERAFPRTLALVTGIAVRGDDPQVTPYVRPLGDGTGISGHFHAAALSYRALPGGLLDLPKTAADLMESQSLLGVLHLLNDTRDISGMGESLFIRGAVWTGPLDLPPLPRTATPGGAS